MIDVAAIGELLIDFTPGGVSENGSALFERNAGGAPANVLAALAKLGNKTAFIGKVGNDAFGMFLTEVLQELQINHRGLVYSDTVPTTLAIVHLDESGDRSFHFYRKPGADVTLEPSEVNTHVIEQAKILHYGSLSLTDQPSEAATIKALKHAKENGLLLSYDPNLRLMLWNSPNEARAKILHVMHYADLMKISEEELAFLTGTDQLEAGSRILAETYGIELLFVTLGEQGCYYRKGDVTGTVAGYAVQAVDTTGAGDSFVGGVLDQYLQLNKPLNKLNQDEIEGMIRFANAVGALTTMKKGAIPAMPTREQVQALYK